MKKGLAVFAFMISGVIGSGSINTAYCEEKAATPAQAPAAASAPATAPAAAPTQAPAKVAPQAAPQQTPAQKETFKISRLVVGTGIENKEPTGAAEIFSATTEKVYCFLEATGISEDTEANFVWYYGDKEIAKVKMALKKGSKWRTYSNKTVAGNKGEWRVDLQDTAGNVLKTVKFKVE